MKLANADAIVGMLDKIKLNRIADKKVKTDLVNDYLYLRHLVKKPREDADELRRKFREDWGEEMNEVELLRKAGLPLGGHETYLEAFDDANATIRSLFDEEVETAVQPVPLEAFLNSCGGEELTLEQVAFLQDNGIIEE